MAEGFDPFGSAPFGALGASIPGTYLNPGPGVMTLSGYQPAYSGINPVGVDFVVREALLSNAGNTGADLVVREILRSSDYETYAAVDLVTREIMWTRTDSLTGVSLVVREILRSKDTLNGDDGFISIIW